LYALDGVALIVEALPDAAKQHDVVGPVVAPSAGALQRFHLRKPRFPEAQHMLRHFKLLRDLADRAEGFGGFRRAAGSAIGPDLGRLVEQIGHAQVDDVVTVLGAGLLSAALI